MRTKNAKSLVVEKVQIYKVCKLHGQMSIRPKGPIVVMLFSFQAYTTITVFCCFFFPRGDLQNYEHRASLPPLPQLSGGEISRSFCLTLTPTPPFSFLESSKRCGGGVKIGVPLWIRTGASRATMHCSPMHLWHATRGCRYPGGDFVSI